MKIVSSTSRAVTGIAVAALMAQPLAGCSGGSQLPPATVASQQPIAARPAAKKSRRSWISPEASSAQALLYVADDLASSVVVYLWPSLQQVGILTDFKTPGAMCVDTKGDVYVVDQTAEAIAEYPHGGLTPVATLTDTLGLPQACSVDPKTGNLAVSNFRSASGYGNVLVFAHARGTPTLYFPASIAYDYFPAYDNKGNLFVDGYTASDTRGLAELPSGGSSFEEIALQQSLVYPSGLEWDGKYLALADSSDDTIYQLAVARGVATTVSSTTLSGGTSLYQFWITGGTKNQEGNGVVGATDASNSVEVWNYPSGGGPTATISGLDSPTGVVVSTK